MKDERSVNSMNLNKQIIGRNDARTRVTVVLPFTEEGLDAFDEFGDPVGGRNPVEVVLPRFDFLGRKEFKSMMDAIEVAQGTAEDGKTDQDKSYDVILATLRPYVSDTVHAVLEEQPMGVLEQISVQWNEASTIPLGELEGSSRSSKKATSRRSATT
jgi:hypothetical protein